LTQQSSDNSAVHGATAPGFEGVRSAFLEYLNVRGDAGAAFSVYQSGREIVHLWGGQREAGVPWTEDTLVCGFSTGKGITALVIQMLSDRGELDIEAPVHTIWPEFAAAGKTDVTVRMLLNHTSGLPTFEGYQDVVSSDDPASFQRGTAIAAGLAAATPLWKPGTQSGYHSLTMGFLLAEVVRRVTGQTIGQFIRAEIVEPLGLDYWVGLPTSEHHRVAPLIADPEFGSDATFAVSNPDTIGGQALFMGPERRLDAVFGRTFNDPAFRVAEVSAAGPHTDARSLARVYGALAQDGELEGVRLVSPESTELFRTETFEGTDVISKIHSRLGLGYALNSPQRYPMGPHRESFGHPGFGGAMAFADPVSELGFGYVTNEMVVGMGTDYRVLALIDAVYSCI
jgi:CubicO group peptidase (beta-lactamase class C family)